MELVVKKNDLLRELQLFQGIVERKNTIPILANVLMEAKGSQIRMLATDPAAGDDRRRYALFSGRRAVYPAARINHAGGDRRPSPRAGQRRSAEDRSQRQRDG